MEKERNISKKWSDNVKTLEMESKSDNRKPPPSSPLCIKITDKDEVIKRKTPSPTGNIYIYMLLHPVPSD